MPTFLSSALLFAVAKTKAENIGLNLRIDNDFNHCCWDCIDHQDKFTDMVLAGNETYGGAITSPSGFTVLSFFAHSALPLTSHASH
jgi:hypothetical protein